MRAMYVVDLAPGQLAALAGLGALRDLDLQLVGVGQIPDRDAEAARGDLLDRRAARVAVTAAARSAPGLRRLRPCCSCRRGGSWRSASVSCASAEIEPKLIAPGAEALDDLARGLHFVERHRRLPVVLEVEQAAQRATVGGACWLMCIGEPPVRVVVAARGPRPAARRSPAGPRRAARRALRQWNSPGFGSDGSRSAVVARDSRARGGAAPLPRARRSSTPCMRLGGAARSSGRSRRRRARAPRRSARPCRTAASRCPSSP